MRATKEDCFPLQIFSSEGQKEKKFHFVTFMGCGTITCVCLSSPLDARFHLHFLLFYRSKYYKPHNCSVFIMQHNWIRSPWLSTDLMQPRGAVSPAALSVMRCL